VVRGAWWASARRPGGHGHGAAAIITAMLPAAMMKAAAAVCALFGSAAGHGSMVMPPSRNSVDAELPAYRNKWPATGSIQPYNCRCTNGTSECNTGQSCFWFSQGCSVGCASCDNNGTRIPGFDHCPEVPKTFPRLLPKYRTANQGAAPGTVADVFRFNPWSAPGKAPVLDPCGVAGGTPQASFNAAEYNTTKFAQQGDYGTVVLQRRPTGTVWRRGSEVTVRFQLTANHGGGVRRTPAAGT
jgi:hypothetical protein